MVGVAIAIAGIKNGVRRKHYASRWVHLFAYKVLEMFLKCAASHNIVLFSSNRDDVYVHSCHYLHRYALLLRMLENVRTLKDLKSNVCPPPLCTRSPTHHAYHESYIYIYIYMFAPGGNEDARWPGRRKYYPQRDSHWLSLLSGWTKVSKCFACALQIGCVYKI